MYLTRSIVQQYHCLDSLPAHDADMPRVWGTLAVVYQKPVIILVELKRADLYACYIQPAPLPPNAGRIGKALHLMLDSLAVGYETKRRERK